MQQDVYKRQEYDWAKVVGEKTCGKGNFQTGFPLSDGSYLNISIGKYYTPQGRSLTDIGVTPDEEIEYDDETYAKLYYGQLSDAEDTQDVYKRQVLAAGGHIASDDAVVVDKKRRKIHAVAAGVVCDLVDVARKGCLLYTSTM